MTTITQQEWSTMKKIFVNYWEKRINIAIAVVIFMALELILKIRFMALISLGVYLIIRASDVFVEQRWKK